MNSRFVLFYIHIYTMVHIQRDRQGNKYRYRSLCLCVCVDLCASSESTRSSHKSVTRSTTSIQILSSKYLHLRSQDSFG